MMIKNLLVLFRFCITTYYNLYGLQTLLPVRPTRDYKLDWHAPLLYHTVLGKRSKTEIHDPADTFSTDHLD